MLPITSVKNGGPSVVSIVTGETLRGSWWGHAQGGEIWRILEALDDDPDVCCHKLAGGKVTLVHRSLWPALYRLALAADRTRGLSELGRQLLAAVQKAPVRLDRFETPDRKKLGKAATILERRLLVTSAAVHTETGKHARVLDTWQRWSDAATRAAADQLTASGAFERLNDACHGVLLPEIAVAQ